LAGVLSLTLVVSSVQLGLVIGGERETDEVEVLSENTTLPAYFIGPSFNAANASTDGTKAIKLNGSAKLGAGASAGSIVLTEAVGGLYSSLFLARPIYSETGFSSMFEMYMGDAGGMTADAWCFIVAKDASTLATTGGGAGLGYEGIKNSFALGYDLYNNDKKGNSTTPLLRFGSNGVLVSEANSPVFRAGTPGVPFTAADVAGLRAKGATINTANNLEGARNYSVYCWVDYNVVEDYINIYFNILPQKPPVPVISKGTPGTADSDATGIPQNVGNSYYIGIVASTGGSYQQMCLRQLYVLNSFAPNALAFTEDGKTLAVDENVSIVEDFTPPTVPIITQKDKTFTVGNSTDDTVVAKYQYRVSADSGVTWIDGAANDGWKDYVFAAGENAGQFDLTAATRVPFIDNPDEHTLVQARAVDTGGNISQVSAYNYADQPKPIASLANPENNAANVRPEYVQSLSLNFSQEIDVESPGQITIEKTSGGAQGVNPSFTGGPIAAQDTRWNAGHNNLTLPLSGIEYGATYRVRVSNFHSVNSVPQDAEQAFVFSTVMRAATPSVSIDYSSDALLLPAANTSYLVNGTARASDANGKIPIASSGTDAHDWHGQTVSVVAAGDGTTIVDSAPSELAIPVKPAAPSGLSGYVGRMYGVTTDMEYAASLSGPWTAVSSVTSSADGPYISVATATYYVRYTAVTSGGVNGFFEEMVHCPLSIRRVPCRAAG
jgi:hypothetical protein